MEVKWLNKCNLKMTANNILLNYDNEMVRGEPHPIPIESIAENKYKLKVEYANLSPDSTTLGMTAFRDYLPLKVYNSDRSQLETVEVMRGTMLIDKSLMSNNGRRRYTIAHELAHWILHRYIFDYRYFAAHSTIKPEKGTDEWFIEWQADYLASSLLLPQYQVKNAFNRLNCSLGKKIALLAEKFEVSKQAMSVFAKENKLMA